MEYDTEAAARVLSRAVAPFVEMPILFQHRRDEFLSALARAATTATLDASGVSREGTLTLIARTINRGVMVHVDASGRVRVTDGRKVLEQTSDQDWVNIPEVEYDRVLNGFVSTEGGKEPRDPLAIVAKTVAEFLLRPQ